MYWYLRVLKKYADFSGRARRKEYWMFFLFNTIFVFIAGILDGTIAVILDATLGTNMIEIGYGLFYVLYVLAIFVPALAVLVRRLHDIGKSGWWFFIFFIPIIGGFWLLFLLITDSQPGENQYGVNPKQKSNFDDQKI